MVPRLRAAKVDLLLSGHSHTYHQSYPLLGQSNGVATFVPDEDAVYDKGAGLVQLVVGTGGTGLRSGLFSDKPYIRAGFSTSTTPAVEPGFSRIDVTPDNLLVSYIAADDGAVLSAFTIRNSNDPTLQTSRFQQGNAGYQGAVDTMLSQASPATSFASAPSLNIDGDDPAGSGQDVQTLLRFDNLFGSGSGQIPVTASLVSARLRLSVTNGGNALVLHRMLQPWTDGVTWSSLIGGISPDGSEALATADATTAAVALGNLDIDVLASLQAWQNGSANWGWLLQPTGADGVDFASAEAAAARPQLEVLWRAAAPVNEPPRAVSLAALTGSLAENTPLPSDRRVADIVISDDGLGSNSISLLGPDAALFRVIDQSLYLRAGTVLDHEQKAGLAVTLQVVDTSLVGSTPVSTDYGLVVTNVEEGAGRAGAPTAQGGEALQEGVTLVADAVSGDPDGIAADVAVDWLRDGSATGQAGAIVTVGPRAAGRWQNRHTYTDGTGLLTTVLSDPVDVAAVENGPGTLAAISADGPLRVGVTLQAGRVSDDPDGDAAAADTSWQWLRNGVPIAGATASTYTSVSADLGASLAVEVSSTDAQSFRSSVTAAAVGPLLEGTPPAVSGIAVEGRQVSVSFNEEIQASVPLAAALTVRVNGVARAISSVSVDTPSRRLVLNLSTLEAAPRPEETVGVDYSDPGGDQSSGVVQDSVGNDLAGFSREADTLRSAGSVPATPALAAAYQSLVLTGTANTSGVGNGNANLILGNSGANSLDGAAGNDDLQGGAGTDTLIGGSGNDSLRGGAGLDRLSGGAGDDLFDFSGSSDGLIGGTASSPQFERLTDLQIAQSSGADRIDTIATAPRTVRQLTSQPTTLSRNAIASLLNGSSGGVPHFPASTASSFTFGSGTGLRTFVAVNDAVAGYDSTRDQILEITGYSGSLAMLTLL